MEKPSKIIESSRSPTTKPRPRVPHPSNTSRLGDSTNSLGSLLQRLPCFSPAKAKESMDLAAERAGRASSGRAECLERPWITGGTGWDGKLGSGVVSSPILPFNLFMAELPHTHEAKAHPAPNPTNQSSQAPNTPKHLDSPVWKLFPWFSFSFFISAFQVEDLVLN